MVCRSTTSVLTSVSLGNPCVWWRAGGVPFSPIPAAALPSFRVVLVFSRGTARYVDVVVHWFGAGGCGVGVGGGWRSGPQSQRRVWGPPGLRERVRGRPGPHAHRALSFIPALFSSHIPRFVVVGGRVRPFSLLSYVLLHH